MLDKIELKERLQIYLMKQVDILGKSNPMIAFTKPLITRAVHKNFSKIDKMLDLISDEKGNIDMENILDEMIESVVTGTPFKVNTSFIGDVEIGGGVIKMNMPLVNKSLVFNESDLQGLKEMLTSNNKNYG